MFDIKGLQDRYPDDYVINMDILGNGYSNPIYVSFIPVELDIAISNNDKKSTVKLLEKYKNRLAKDVYNKLLYKYG